MSSKYPRGSEWRKWDLHVHTPASSLNNSLGDDWDIYIERLIEAAKKHDISVITTADYFSIEGYEKILSYYDKKKRIFEADKKGKEIFIIPGIELRLDNFNSKEESINLHVLFDPEKCSKDFIRSNFLEQLKVSYRGNTYPLNKQNMLAIGKSILEECPIGAGEDFSGISVSKEKKYLSKALSVISLNKTDINEALEEVQKILGEGKIYERSYLIAVAGKGHGSLKSLKWFEENKDFSRAGLVREDITNQADLVFSNDDDDRLFYLGEKSDTPMDEVKLRFENFKPCIWGSDSDDLNDLLHPSNGKTLDYTWIKADPTFQGLKSIMREPGSRVFIGEAPEEIIKRKQEKHRFIDKIAIKKTNSSNIKDIWFDNEIKLNENLIAIIGNRGMGKSALAEIIGLLGNTKNFKHFSYLHKDKFRKDNLAKNFKASIEWKDKTNSEINLFEDPNPTDVERVKCIPQNYFETLCNNLDFRFQQEINKAIFSHIEESDRLDKTNLEDLISCKTENIDSQVKLLQVKVEKLNKNLIGLEKKTEDVYKEDLKKRSIKLI